MERWPGTCFWFVEPRYRWKDEEPLKSLHRECRDVARAGGEIAHEAGERRLTSRKGVVTQGAADAGSSGGVFQAGRTKSPTPQEKDRKKETKEAHDECEASAWGEERIESWKLVVGERAYVSGRREGG